MNITVTDKRIESWCGRVSSQRGQSYYQAGRVHFTRIAEDKEIFKAVVKGSKNYQVEVQFQAADEVDADCTCPAFYEYEGFCKHVAAVLYAVRDLKLDGGREEEPGFFGDRLAPVPEGVLMPRITGFANSADPYASDRKLMDSVLGLLEDKPRRTAASRILTEWRSALELELIVRPINYGYEKTLLSVELKIGPKRLYVVQKIRPFLEAFSQGKPYEFTRLFTYDPEQFCFREEHDAILKKLAEVCRVERLYRESLTPYYAGVSGQDRSLPVPPTSWDTLMPLLLEASGVRLEVRGREYEGLRFSGEKGLPLRFRFDEPEVSGSPKGTDRRNGSRAAQAGTDPDTPVYRLGIDGLDELELLEPYGLLIADGELRRLEPDICRRLQELKRLMGSSYKKEILIPKKEAEPFMEKAVPGLMKLGSVQIAPSISGRMVQAPLKARVFLDRVRDRLLAGLEFHYGDIVVNPLETGRGRGTDRILMRDGDRERQILEVMDRSLFRKTESGYYMDDEEAEYDFLYHGMPELEKLADIYATSSVKLRLQPLLTPPKVKVDVDQRTDWLEVKFNLEGIPESEIRHVLRSLREKRRYHRLPDGALLPLESEDYEEINRLLQELGLLPGELKGAELRLPVVRGLQLIESREKGRAVSLGKSLRRLLENLRNPDNLDFPVPEQLDAVLRDYQKLGYQWLKTLAYYRFGGVLADDMGLGKTLQSIAFLVSELAEIRESQQPALIVCPASLIYNWRNELKRFAPELRAVIADGTKPERTRILKDRSSADVIITSYPMLRRDMLLYAGGEPFHTLLLDEAQAFKNHATQTAQAVKGIEAKYRFALTGTPVENRLEELWSLYDAVFPGLFPGRKEFNELPRETVAKKIRPFLLRRLKTDVLKELPEKIETLQASELLPEQKKLYAAYLAELQQETLKHLAQESFGRQRIRILAGLTRLRQICCHPVLFVEGYEGSSAKLEQLLELVEECRSAGKRMLVFSQFTEMLGVIRQDLMQRGIPFFYLDGQTPPNERVELCSRFNGGERDLFLISLKAGGTGLNLTGADTVILYDLWWNPAVEEQAADRAYRMGQKNVVQVIRLVAEGTVEEKMYELQQRKKNLIEEVIRPGEESVSSLTEQEIRELLNI